MVTEGLQDAGNSRDILWASNCLDLEQMRIRYCPDFNPYIGSGQEHLVELGTVGSPALGPGGHTQEKPQDAEGWELQVVHYAGDHTGEKAHFPHW